MFSAPSPPPLPAAPPPPPSPPLYGTDQPRGAAGQQRPGRTGIGQNQTVLGGALAPGALGTPGLTGGTLLGS